MFATQNLYTRMELGFLYPTFATTFKDRFLLIEQPYFDESERRGMPVIAGGFLYETKKVLNLDKKHE